MQIYTEGGGVRQRERAVTPLRHQPAENTRKHVSASSGRHAAVAGGVAENSAGAVRHCRPVVLELGTYTGLSVAQKEGQSAGNAVWQAVAAECEILRYPEEQVAYYAAQTRAKYRYYARENDLKYEEVLNLFETTEEEIEAQARALVAEDLVYRAVAEDAGIEITQEEKDRLFERYVTKYIEDYGYSRDYVIGNMTDEIVESMRYDKTTEFLITHNTFPGK